MGKGVLGRCAVLAVLLILTGTTPVRASGESPAHVVHYDHVRVDLVTAAGTRVTIKTELAVTPEQLEQGLMFRRQLAPESGMLFDFGAPRLVAMWMKNTLIPLDMLFIDASGTIRYIEEQAPPHSLDPRGPTLPVRAVMELPGGTARRLGLRPGDQVDYPIFHPVPVGFR